MKTLIINAKMSNTGTIHDLASNTYDRNIKFRKGMQYAVVNAAYYGGKGYTTHATAASAAAESQKRGEYSHKVIDCEGNQYAECWGELRADGVLMESHSVDKDK